MNDPAVRKGLGPRLRGEHGIGNKAPFGAARHFPRRGKINETEIFPLWGKYRRSRGRGLPLDHLELDRQALRAVDEGALGQLHLAVQAD
jgi:hypothetical protein